MTDAIWNVKAILIAILHPMSSRSSDRPRLTRKGAATRARIVDAAAELIFQQGVAGTTVEEVRDGAQVSSSQLYHYFEDKPALVRAVIERQAEHGYRHAGAVRPQQPRWATGVARFRGRSQPRDGRARRLSGWLAGCRARRDRARSQGSGCGVLQTLGGQHHGRSSADARARPTRPEADPRQLALALLAALEGGLLLAQIQRDSEPLAAALDAMLTLIATLSSTTSTSLNAEPD